MCLINLSYLFVASLVAFCEWPCHSIHQPSQIWSSNSCQKNKQFRSIWAHTTESSLVVSWSSAWIKWSSSQSVATCWGEDTFFIATLQYFSTHFSVWPVMSPKAVIFPNEVVLLFERVSSVSPVVANFLNNSVSDWAAWRSNFASLCVHFQNTWSVNGGGYAKSISSCRMFHMGFHGLFSKFFSST